jgi:hypothetical protein
MPRQNQVTPLGRIIAVPERGTLMGNRGVLHDGAGANRSSGRHRATASDGHAPPARGYWF